MRTYNVNHTTHKKFTYIVVCLGETTITSHHKARLGGVERWSFSSFLPCLRMRHFHQLKAKNNDLKGNTGIIGTFLGYVCHITWPGGTRDPEGHFLLYNGAFLLGFHRESPWP